MSAWVYFFSKFTDEALLLEGLAACLLLSALSAIWILRRRKQGEALIPASAVKNYLSGLASDTQSIHENLFGEGIAGGPALNGGPRYAPASTAATAASGATATVTQSTDPMVLELEGKLASQLREIQTLHLQKSELEKNLANSPLGGKPSGDAAPGENPASAAEAQEFRLKVSELEARLEEYAVIEDDLANLKRLQQENAKLKAQLAGGAPAAEATQAAAPAVPESTATKETPPTAKEAAPLSTKDAAKETAPSKAEPAPAAAPVAAPAVSKAAPAQAAAPALAAPAATASNAAPAAAAPPAADAAGSPPPKNDDELIAEFEKMLST